MKILENKVKLNKNAIRKRIAISILLTGVLFVNGCSNLLGFDKALQEKTDERGSGGNVIEKDISENKEIENDFNTDILDKSETREYILPETIWNITGMTAEEQAESFRDDNEGKQNFVDIEVRDEALVLTMTEEQKENYEEEIEARIFEDIEEAIDKEDIRIEISEDYKKVKMVLGENSTIEGFHVTLVKMSSEIGVYQILNGCAPEEWGFRLITERDEQVLINSNVPHGTWKLTEDDFEGKISSAELRD